MGYKEFEIKVPLHITEDELRLLIGRKSGVENFDYQIIRKSLDARNKRNIHWLFKFGVSSKELSEGEKPDFPNLDLSPKKYQSSAIVVGSGPAGIFSALVLAESGMKVTLIEQGNNVQTRKNSIEHFEASGKFDEINNYSFGEGGAGTFSDGKLTSRTKGISKERNYIFQNFISAGGPEEIMYMTHPHLGSDKLFKITQNLRQKLESLGGEILFETKLEDIIISGNSVSQIVTNKGVITGEHIVLAPGHSSYETYKMLIRRQVQFRTKNFAIGMRAEHQQKTINMAQWGVEQLSGIKAAEYRLSSNDAAKPVYSFCMCPGGIVVPATAYKHSNIVNGMSLYKRDNNFANAAVVAGTHPDELLQKEASPIEALEWLEALENRFYTYSNSYNAPAVRIKDFLNNKVSKDFNPSSYPFDLLPANMNELLPKALIDSLRIGLKSFTRKLKNYDQGTLIGLESKTSAPIQVVRDKETYQSTYENLYIAGEGSGWAGGIVSSAADGIRAALSILDRAK